MFTRPGMAIEYELADCGVEDAEAGAASTWRPPGVPAPAAVRQVAKSPAPSAEKAAARSKGEV